jgi:hypothetical protein
VDSQAFGETFMKLNLFIFLFLVAFMLIVFSLFAACGDDDDADADDDDDAGEDDDDSVDDDDSEMDDDDSTGDDDDASPGDVWTDSTTGLMWQNGNDNQLNWTDAIAYCHDLDWGGYDDWHLPTISELRSLIRGCEATASGGACGITDSCTAYDTCWDEVCWSCDEWQGPANGIFWPSELIGTGGWYWSSSDVSDYDNWAWAIPFWGGDIDGYDTTLAVYVRCVR